MNRRETSISGIENSISFVKEYDSELDWSDVMRLEFINLLLQQIADRVELSREYDAIYGSLNDWEKDENRRLDADAMQSIRSVRRAHG